MRPDDHRRKWDKDEFERIAAERIREEIEEEEHAKKKGRIKKHNAKDGDQTYFEQRNTTQSICILQTNCDYLP